MPLRQLDHADFLVHQISGDENAPVVIYLPGVHGDWTPLHKARPLLGEALRVVEVAYPRMPDWTIEDFADALEALLDRLHLGAVHLVGESFGSLVAWEFGLTRPERVKSLLLIGGFTQPPGLGKVILARRGLSLIPSVLFERGIDTYVGLKKFLGELRPAPRGYKEPYPALRTESGRQAVLNRLDLIAETDVRHRLHEVDFPVHYVGGGEDRIVPVHREIKTLRRILDRENGFASHVIPGAPHMVITSHPEDTVEQIVDWVQSNEAREIERAREYQEELNRHKVD